MSPQPSQSADEAGSLLSTIYETCFGSTTNTILTVACVYIIYKLFRGDSRKANSEPQFKVPPPLKKHNMTMEELKKYDGRGEDGRICLAVLNKVYDVSKGYRFYGPNGPYSTFAGRDATRALATFDVNAAKDDYDDYSNLTASEKSSVEEWQMQLSERYDYVGKLIRPGEDPEEEEEPEEKDKE